MKEEILAVTTNNIEGYRILKYISPIVANVVIGTGFLTDLFAGFTDIFGGRSDAYQRQLKELYETAINQLKKEAQEKGANCILGMKIDLDEISGKGMQMFMLNAIGTAVIIKTEEEYNEIKNNDEKEKEARTEKELEVMEKLSKNEKNFDELKKLFDNEEDKFKKSVIARELSELGYMYYSRFIIK
jgi:uncharacterized protein YbjQ (UPF0145 family)